MKNNLKKNEDIKVYELEEVEEIVGVKKRTLLDYCRSGKLKAVKLGGHWKVSEDNLRAFINGD